MSVKRAYEVESALRQSWPCVIRDKIVAVLGILLTMPVMSFCWLAIRFIDGSQPVFRQVRVGQSGVPFTIYKFRTMSSSGSALSVTVANDPRVTRLGRLLRRTKLDELPQLFNVLLGHMSLVGPRPGLPSTVENWPDQLRRRVLAAKPGLTDPASLEYVEMDAAVGNRVNPEQYYLESIVPHKLEMSARYLECRDFRSDLSVLHRTLWTVLGGLSGSRRHS